MQKANAGEGSGGVVEGWSGGVVEWHGRALKPVDAGSSTPRVLSSSLNQYRNYEGRLASLGSRRERFEGLFCEQQAGVLPLRPAGVIAINRVVPAFDVEVRIVTGAQEFVDDLRPVSLAQAGKAMLGHAGMAEPISLQQGPVDESVLGVDVKNARAEFAQVGHRINELAEQVAGIPLQSDVFAFALVEKAFPEGGLAHHVVVHDGLMPGPLRAILKGQAHAKPSGQPGQRLPKSEQLGQIILERFIDRVAPARVGFHFHHGAGKPRNGFDADLRGDFNGALKNGARPIRLARIERVLVKGADGGNADAAGAGLGGELCGKGFPIGVGRRGGTFRKAHPLGGTETEPLHPIQVFQSAGQDTDSHGVCFR